MWKQERNEDLSAEWLTPGGCAQVIPELSCPMRNLLQNRSFVSTESCVEMTVWITKQLTSVWTQVLRCPKAGKHFNCTCTFTLLVIFGYHHTKNIAGFLVSRGWEDDIKANQKGSFRAESYDKLVQVLKILMDPGSLTHTTTSSLSDPSSSGEAVPKSLRKSDHILPGAGSVQL